MFENFKQHLSWIPQNAASSDLSQASLPKELSAFLTEFGGGSYRQGLYRVHLPAEVENRTAMVVAAFPAFDGRVTCFADDWLGRHFALDASRAILDKAAVVMFEPGTGEALEIPCDLTEFHEQEIIDHEDAALASGFFVEWLRAGNLRPARGQCAGYKQPLFLGGNDTIENLELSDLGVYWSLMAQLLAKIRDLPLGTRIGKVKIKQ